MRTLHDFHERHHRLAQVRYESFHLSILVQTVILRPGIEGIETGSDRGHTDVDTSPCRKVAGRLASSLMD